MEEDFDTHFGQILNRYQSNQMSLVEAKRKLADLLRHRSQQPGPAIGFDLSSLSNLDPRLGLLLRETFGELNLLVFEHANLFPGFAGAAKQTMSDATMQAMLKGTTVIRTEHVLLGLIQADSALLARFLDSQDTVEAIRTQVEAQAAPGEDGPPTCEPLFSEECRLVLAYAEEEAQRLSDRAIGTKHLLMGLLREQDGLASKILLEHGFELSKIRNEFI